MLIGTFFFLSFFSTYRKMTTIATLVPVQLVTYKKRCVKGEAENKVGETECGHARKPKKQKRTVVEKVTEAEAS